LFYHYWIYQRVVAICSIESSPELHNNKPASLCAVIRLAAEVEESHLHLPAVQHGHYIVAGRPARYKLEKGFISSPTQPRIDAVPPDIAKYTLFCGCCDVSCEQASKKCGVMHHSQNPVLGSKHPEFLADDL
jgi:hypothetical protein